MRLECFHAIRYLPTYNGIDTFNEFECTENGWSLPDDMKPIKCRHIICPALLDVSEEIEVECRWRDQACTSLVPVPYVHENVNDEIYQHCECNTAAYKCKKEG